MTSCFNTLYRHFLPLMVFLTVTGAFTLSGCSGGSGSPPPPPPPPTPTITAVTVSPANLNLFVKATQQFTANVQGTGKFSTAVNWYVSGVQGGNSTVGTIDSTGFYTAPNSVPNPSTVTVMAQSTQDTSKSGTSSATIAPENVQISVSPAAATLQLGGTQQFSVSVTGTANQAFYWTINGQTTNAATPWGNMIPTGLYTAPSTLPANPTVTLTATSMEDQTKSFSAVAKILATAGGITVSITPSNPQVLFDGSQSVQFTAAVSGTSNTGVNWSADPGAGTITTDGVFTPLAFTCGTVVPTPVIHAVSVANQGAQATTTVNLVPPTPVITQLSPQPAQAETALQVSGSFASFAAGTIFFPGPNATSIPTTAYVTSPTTVATTVPLGSTSGPLTFQQNCGNASIGFQYPPQQSNALNFQRLPRLRIRADRKDLAAGESVQLYAVMLGDSTPQQVTWGNGISSSGIYTAPATVTQSTPVTLSACIENASACDSLIVQVSPLRIDPEAPVVANGDTLQLSAITGGSAVAPTWNILAGGGSLQSNGLYTAPTTLTDSGPVLVSATYGGVTGSASIGVTGSSPGLINRVNDYVDNNSTTSFGTITSSLAVDGTRAYVLSVDSPYTLGGPKYCWIDTYDLTDPAHPVWLDAAEALNFEPSTSYCAGVLYTYGGFLFEILSYNLTQEIAVFKFQNGHLALQNIFQIPIISGIPLAGGTYSFNQGIFYAIPGLADNNPGGDGQNVLAYVFDLRSGNMVQTNLSLPLPSPGVTSDLFAPTGAGNLVYLLVRQPATPAVPTFKIAVYDLTATPPSMVASVDAMVGANQPIGGILKIVGNTLYDGWDVYDISSAVPSRLGTNPYNFLDFNANGSLAIAGNEAVDVTNPTSPVVKSILDDGFSNLANPIWVGDLLYTTEGGDGLAIFSAVNPGGQILLNELPGEGTYGAILDQIVDGTTLYTAQESDGPIVTIYNLSSSSPAAVGSYNESGQSPLSLALYQNFLFLGTQQSILVLDVSNSASPAKVATVPISANALAISGNFLFVGTTDNHLVVFDVSNPKVPAQIAQVTLSDLPIRLNAVGNLLYVADNTAGLLIYGVSTPSSPALLAQYKPSSAIGDVAINGNLAFLAAAENGLIILDITNPAAPAALSQVPISSLCVAVGLCLDPVATSVGVYGGLVYVGSSGTAYGKVFGFDYTVPSHPRLVSMASYGGALDDTVLNFAFYQTQMFVGGSLYAVADRQADISQPRNVINLYYSNFPNGSGSFISASQRNVPYSYNHKAAWKPRR